MATFRITTSCLVDGQICQNVFHIVHTGGITMPTMADTISTQWLSEIRPFQHTGAVWFDIEVRQVSPIGPAAVHKTITLAGTGPAEGQQDVPFCARVLQFQTALAGRHGRGRLFVAGTSFQSWDKGIIKATSITAGQPFVNNLIARFVGPTPSSGLRLVIARRSDPSQTVDVTNIVQRTILGRMGSRAIGVGI